MPNDFSIVKLVLDASLVVQVVMAMLLVASLLSWTVVFQKWRATRQARQEAEVFQERFWSGGEYVSLYNQVAANRGANIGLAAIFEAGFREFSRQKGQPQIMLEGAQRGMRVALSREIDRLEAHLPFLATVASASPYVGLFGTVWGIMNAMTALGQVTNASLAMVAPGIAEALIATAMGLFAAIPAVIAYNRYINDITRLENHYNNFVEEFSSILQRQAYT